MASSVCNFSAGPAKIPQEVLEQVSKDVLSYKKTGVGVLEISHRSADFLAILGEAKLETKRVLKIPQNYQVLLMHGGGTGQFAAVAMNLMGRTGSADYIITGTWSKQAAAEASKYGTVNKVLEEDTTKGVPDVSEWTLDRQASYLYYCDNETIEGVEFPFVPEPPAGVPLVCDMSSNICTRSFDITKYGLVFAGAQKNIGAAGVTMVIIRDDLLKIEAAPICPIILNYANTAKKLSNYNTPPVYAIHVVGHMMKWIEREGGVEEMEKRAKEKSDLLYAAIDSSNGYYVNTVTTRSRVNVVFNIFKDGERFIELEEDFFSLADSQKLKGLKGHRSMGGMRASLYNAVTVEDVKKLIEYMEKFQKENPV